MIFALGKLLAPFKSTVVMVVLAGVFVAGGWISWWLFHCKDDIQSSFNAEENLIDDIKVNEDVKNERIIYVKEYVKNTGGNRDCLSDDDVRVFNGGEVDPVPEDPGS